MIATSKPSKPTVEPTYAVSATLGDWMGINGRALKPWHAGQDTLCPRISVFSFQKIVFFGFSASLLPPNWRRKAQSALEVYTSR
jgi:hypothetical protein